MSALLAVDVIYVILLLLVVIVLLVLWGVWRSRTEVTQLRERVEDTLPPGDLLAGPCDWCVERGHRGCLCAWLEDDKECVCQQIEADGGT